MLREIKFRAFDKPNKEMFDVEALTENNLYSSYDEYSLENSVYSNRDECELMQLTGLKDKNSKDVFSDDLLKNSDGDIFRVYHTVGGFAIKAKYWSKDLSSENETDELIFQPLPDPQYRCYINSSCEVIGNIHENPELC